MTNYRGGTYEQCVQDDATISANIGLPDGKGTVNWANPQETTTPNLWVYQDFPEEGRRGFTYEEATAGVQCPIVTDFQFPGPVEV